MGWIIHKHNNESDIITFIEIQSIDGDLKDNIDKYISKICYGHEYFSNIEAKKYIKEFLNTENEERKKGAISEFFLHLYLICEGFIQECAFNNLEESSLKKGFDGVYKDENEEVWYMESKSGDENSCTHIAKVQEAYRDLKNKFESKVKNDPWKNAINHVLVTTQDASLIDKFRQLSIRFTHKQANNLCDFNIIPSGSVFANKCTISYDDENTISSSLYNYFSTRNKKGLYAICVTNTSIAQFIAYLDK